MYGVPKVLSINEILKKVSEWDLWRYYIPGVKIGGSFNSPLRKDNNPSASLFVATSGNILLKDFKLGTFNIWQFLQHKYGLTFVEALKVVDHDFKLGLNVETTFTKPTMEYFGITTNDKISSAEYSKLSIKKREWTLVDKAYWDQFGLSLEFVEQHGIFPLQNYWVNENLVYWYTIYDPAYSIEFGRGKRKIYRPFAQSFKWLTNAPNTIIQGDKFLSETGKELIITKSYKDVLVLKNLNFQAVAPQSETIFIEESKFKEYKERFQHIYILWDNDETGRKYSTKFTEKHQLLPIFVPENSGEKDISDFYKTYGEEGTVLLIQDLLYGTNKKTKEIS